MTENKKRGLRKPIQIALTAAALAVVMCVTAAAANPEAVQQLWKSFSVAVIYDDGDTVVVQTTMPEISVERVDERVMLTVDDVQTDITEALERDGVFTQTFESEKGTAEVTVQSDLTWGITLPMENGEVVSYHSGDEAAINFPAEWAVNLTDGGLGMVMADKGSSVTYTFTDDESVTNAIYLPPEE